MSSFVGIQCPTCRGLGEYLARRSGNHRTTTKPAGRCAGCQWRRREQIRKGSMQRGRLVGMCGRCRIVRARRTARPHVLARDVRRFVRCRRCRGTGLI